ncbi:MAG: hypothetical protein R3C56_24230 [Pirellulaceae bacterium]
MIGFDHDCFLRFSSEQYSHGSGKVLMRRGSEGWYVLRVAGDSAFVNQHLLEDKSPLGSGDIVRLSSRGPDVQFTMQSGGVAVRALVDRFLPSHPHAPRGPAAGPAKRPAPEAAPLPQQQMPPMQSPLLGGAACRCCANDCDASSTGKSKTRYYHSGQCCLQGSPQNTEQEPDQHDHRCSRRNSSAAGGVSVSKHVAADSDREARDQTSSTRIAAGGT